MQLVSKVACGMYIRISCGDGGSPPKFSLAVTEELLADKLIIVEERWSVPDTPGELNLERSLLADLDVELSVKSNDTTWKLRVWSGRVIGIGELIDGTVEYSPLDQKLFSDE